MTYKTTRWLSGLILLVAVAAAGLTAPPRNAAAVIIPTIDATACGGDSFSDIFDGTSAYCSFEADGVEVVIGANSCNVAGACLGLADDVSIGSDACQGSSACFQAGSVGGHATIGDSSCDGDDACSQAGAGGGHATIASGACLGSNACNSAGFGGRATIGNESCQASSACVEAGAFGGRATVGDNSCGGDHACYHAGFGGGVAIGSNACNGDSVCHGAGAFIGGVSIGDCENNDPQVPECQDPDTDGDGVPDAVDACPTEAVVDGKDADGDGCPDTASGLEVLISDELSLPGGLENSLLSSLTGAEASLASGNPNAATGKLHAFIHKVQAQRGKKLTEEQADLLITYANNLLP